MRIIEGLGDLDASDRGASAAIGNFDGVHLGHQALIESARGHAATDKPLGVITFEPHPRRFFQPDSAPFRLTRAAEKARILQQLGVQRLFKLNFDAAMAGMPAEDFVANVLKRDLNLSHIVTGADFRFGKGRTGDTDLLRKMGARMGFGVTVHDLIGDETGDFASSALRTLIKEGRCEDAARQLGRWHTVRGPVVKGDQRGRDLGYPTANLLFDDCLIPRYGIYATWVDVLDGPLSGRYPGVASIGERPTFGINAPNFEVHLFDFSGDLYGTQISVSLVKYLRGEEKFDSVEDLITQMDADSADARRVLADKP